MIPRISLLRIVNDFETPTRCLVTAAGIDWDWGVSRDDISVSIDLSFVGQGGLDTGTAQSNSSYNLFLADDSSMTYGLASLSLTPQLPIGITRYVRIGNWPTGPNANGNWLRMMTAGNRTHGLVHMSQIQPAGRFAHTEKCGGTYQQQKYKACVFTGLPPTAYFAFGHALITSSNDLMLVSVNPNDPDNDRVAVIAYSKGSKNLMLRAYWEAAITTPQTLYMLNTHAGDGVVVNGWYDTINAT